MFGKYYFIWFCFCTAAYKHGDGKKIDGRRVLVDVERGRTVKGWLPRRLGGGLGGTRKGAPDENVKHSGRDEARTEEREQRGDRYENKERRERDRDRSEKRRSRSRDRERERGDKEKEKRRRSKSPKDRDRSDRERRSRYDNNSVSSRRSKSGRESNYNNEDQAGGDGIEKRKSRSKERESRKRHTREGKSRSISRERKRSHRDQYDNGRLDKIDIKNEIMIKEEPEDTLYDNAGAYENEQFNNPYGDNSNSSSYDQYQAQNYSQPTYVAYNTKDDTP